MPDTDTLPVDPRTANFDGDVTDSVDLNSDPIALLQIAMNRIRGGMYMSSYESQTLETMQQLLAMLVFEKRSMTREQRVSFLRRYHMAAERGWPDEYGRNFGVGDYAIMVQSTFGMDGAVVIPWCGMFLCIEKDGYTHS